MEDIHREIVRKVDQLKYKVNDLVDDPNHPHARKLRREVDELVNDIKVKKSIRNIEARFRNIRQVLQDMRDQGEEAMDFSHIDLFMRQCFEMDNHIQKNYPY